MEELWVVPMSTPTVLALYGAEAEQREALAIFEQLGAAPAARALRKRHARPGRARCSARLPDVDADQSARPHADARPRFSPCCQQVCAIRSIAKRLFVSTKTVDHHVSAILTKLGVPSRAEAVALMSRQSGEAG